MTKYSVSPRLGNYRAFMTLAILAMLIVTCVPISFAADNDEKVKVAVDRAEWNLRIAEKQYDRGLFKEAELTLVQIKPFVSKLSLSEQGKYNSLDRKVRDALGERRNVLATMKLSDDLAAQGQYQQAIEELNSIRKSKSLTDAEREYVDSNIENLRNEYNLTKKQPDYS